MNFSPSHLQIQQQNLSSILNTNETTLEQTCLHRLKQQRFKIQDLVSLTQNQQSQIQDKQETIFELRQQIETIQTDISFREAYEDLKNEFQALSEKYHFEKSENQAKQAKNKQELANLSMKLSELTKSQKHLKQQIDRLEIHWRGIVQDKNQTLTLVQREYTLKEQLLKEKVKNLTLKCKELKSTERQNSAYFRETSQQIRNKSRNKDKELERIKRVLDVSQNQCSQYRLRISEKENELQLQREQMKEDLQNLNLVITSLRKEVTQKIIQIQTLKDNLRKLQLKNQNLEDTLETIQYKEKHSRTRHCLSEQRLCREKSSRIKLEDEVSKIKRQNLKHVEDYNVLQIQLHKWKNIAEKRQQSSVTRKLFSNSAFR